MRRITAVPDGQKVCTMCAEAKPNSMFRGRKGTAYLFPNCKACEYVRSTKYPSRNKYRKAGKAKVRYLERVVTKAGRRPGPACEICGTIFSDQHANKICYDHNHGTGLFRGWLCKSCNSAAGLLGDNPNLAKALGQYLKLNGYTKTKGW
jgi:hypothetical protein